jgi:hypothetical protein
VCTKPPGALLGGSSNRAKRERPGLTRVGSHFVGDHARTVIQKMTWCRYPNDFVRVQLQRLPVLVVKTRVCHGVWTEFESGKEFAQLIRIIRVLLEGRASAAELNAHGILAANLVRRQRR